MLIQNVLAGSCLHYVVDGLISPLLKTVASGEFLRILTSRLPAGMVCLFFFLM